METKPYRKKCLTAKPERCVVCGAEERIDVHHADGNRENDALDNLVPLCKPCHREIHEKSHAPRRVTDGRTRQFIEVLNGNLPNESLGTAGWPPDIPRKIAENHRFTYAVLKNHKPESHPWESYLKELKGRANAARSPVGGGERAPKIALSESGAKVRLDAEFHAAISKLYAAVVANADV